MERLIVALDFPSEHRALNLVRDLKGAVNFFKVGLQLYTATGPDIVRKIKAEGGKVFLDLKFLDIPNTVSRAGILSPLAPDSPRVTFTRMDFWRCDTCRFTFDRADYGSEGLREHALSHLDADRILQRGIDHPHSDSDA